MTIMYKGHNIVFIVGCPRSGTTWLQRLLASHPKVRTGQESDIFDVYIGPQLRAWRRDTNSESSGRGIVGLGCYFTEEEFLNLLRGYMMKLLRPIIGDLHSDEIFIEKTPSHVLYIPEILELLPDSRIIHLIRDPRDVVASILSASKSWGKNWAPKYAWQATRMWIRHVRSGIEAGKNLRRSQYYELKYEDLQVNTYEKLKEICHFIGINWDEQWLKETVKINDPNKAKETGGTPIPLKGEASKKIGFTAKEPEGFVRKAKVGSWREDLSLLEKLQVWSFAHKLMKELGYKWKLGLFF